MSLHEGDEVEVVLRDGQLVIVRMEGAPTRGDRIVNHMAGRLRTEATTDELMDLLRGEDD